MKNNSKLILVSLVLLIGITFVGCNKAGNQAKYEFNSFADYQDTVDSLANKTIAEKLNVSLDPEDIEEYLKEQGQGKDTEAVQNMIQLIGEEEYYKSIQSYYISLISSDKTREIADQLSEDDIKKSIEENEELFEAMNLSDEVDRTNFVKAIESTKQLEKIRLDAYSEAVVEVLENVNPEYLKSLKLDNSEENLDKHLTNQVLSSMFN